MKINLPQKVKFIIDEIYDDGYEAFIVGGCVRDSILGIIPHDYDITTNAKPIDIKRIFSKFKTVDNGIKHGTIGVIIEKEVYEITTYRIEGEYENNRRPKNVEFTSNIVDDLKRRDFTINAIAYNDRVGIVDKFNGLDDIERKIVKTVGDPDERFSEDGLRLIRAIRFSSKLGFRIENKTLYSIYKNANIIKNISRERITDEVTKIIMGANPIKFVLLMETDILKNIDVYRYKNKNIDEIEKTLSILKECDDDVVQRLAMIEYILSFNEIDMLDEKDRSRYYIDNIMPNNIVNSLVYSKKIMKDTNILIEYMYKDISYNNVKIKYILGEIGSELLKKVLKLKKMYNNYCLGEKLNKGDIEEKNTVIDNCVNEIIKIEDNKECYTIKELDIDGQILKNYGYKGKEIGEMLEYMLKVVINKPELNKKEELVKLLH